MSVKPINSVQFEYYLMRLRDHQVPNRSFFLSDLQVADSNDGIPARLTMDRAMDLNQTKYIPSFDNIQR